MAWRAGRQDGRLGGEPFLLDRREVEMTIGTQIERLFSGQFADRQGRFNYIEFAQVLRVNDGEPEREDKLTL